MEEMVDVIDDDFNVLKSVSKREAIKKLWKHKGAAVIIKNNKGELFIKLRKKNKKVHPHFWEIGVGGAVKSGETFEEAAKRELFEECKIKGKIKFLFDFEYCGSEIYYKAKIYETIFNGKIVVDPLESEEGRWASLEEIKQLMKKKAFAPDYDKFFKKYLKTVEK